MQGHRRRRETQKSSATSISPKGGGGTASISLSLLLYDVTDIASSSLRELDAVALATNVTIFMERDTKVPPTFRTDSAMRMISSLLSDEGDVAAVENLCIVRAKALQIQHSLPAGKSVENNQLRVRGV